MTAQSSYTPCYVRLHQYDKQLLMRTEAPYKRVVQIKHWPWFALGRFVMSQLVQLITMLRAATHPLSLRASRMFKTVRQSCRHLIVTASGVHCFIFQTILW